MVTAKSRSFVTYGFGFSGSGAAVSLVGLKVQVEVRFVNSRLSA